MPAPTLKYLIVEWFGEPKAIVFSATLNHDQIVPELRMAVIAAGTCFRDNHGWRCSGKSSSLGIASRGCTDEVILESQLP